MYFVLFLKLFFSFWDAVLTNLFCGTFGEKPNLWSSLRICTSWYLTPAFCWMRSITCLKSQPVLLFDSSCMILSVVSLDTIEGFPLLGLSLRPFIPSSSYLLPFIGPSSSIYGVPKLQTQYAVCQMMLWL